MTTALNPPLRTGDRLDRPTFHARYEAASPITHAELIAGTVYVSPPHVRNDHGSAHARLTYALGHFSRFTPGVGVGLRLTTLIADDAEVQPDARLFVRTGGRTRVTADAGAGAVECAAVLLPACRVLWLTRDRSGRLTQTPPDVDGTYRSRAFPGLWLDPAALLRGDLNRLATVVEQGVATDAHGAFVADLAARPANPTGRPDVLLRTP